MIESLRRGIVRAAMISLLILLVLLNVVVTAVCLIQLDAQTDRELDALSSDRMSMNNERVNSSVGTLKYFTCVTDRTGQMVMANIIFDPSVGENTVREYTGRALEGADTGRIGSYKYKVTHMTFGAKRIVFLDTAARTRSAHGIILTVAAVSAVCMGLMYVIVSLVAERAMRPIAENIEKQRRFVADAGHEIKTPLAIIMANTDALELHLGQNKWSGNIRSQTQRLGGLMTQLLNLSRYDETGTGTEYTQVEFSACTHRRCEEFEVLAAGRGCRIEASLEPGIVVWGDSSALDELVGILLDNAVKYCAGQSVIRVELSRSGGSCVLEISNTCDELPAVEPETLFERFYRADSARTQCSGGSGIGLSVARAAAIAHGASLRAMYDDEHTIRLRLEIPCKSL